MRDRAGILAYVAALGVAAVMDALVKLVVARVGLAEILLWRSLGALLLLLPVLWLTGRLGRLRPVKPGFVALRGLVLAGATALFFYGLGGLTLPVAYTITFTMPLMMAAMAAIALREPIGVRGIFAILLGFAGVLVALEVRPWALGDAAFGWHAAAALAATFLYALALVAIRVADQAESTEALVLGGMIATALLALGLLPGAGAGRAEGAEWLALAGIAAAAAASQVLITQAFRWATATRLAPFEYTVLIWGIVLGVAIWGDWPSPATWVGAGLVVTATVIAARQRQD